VGRSQEDVCVCLGSDSTVLSGQQEGSGLLQSGLDDGFTAGGDSGVKLVKHADCRLPVYTSVRDRDAVFESGGSFGGYVLTAGVDVGLDHDAGDGRNVGSTRLQLIANCVYDFRLVGEVLVRVSVRAVDHDARPHIRSRLLHGRNSSADGLGVVVGALGTAAEDDVHVAVTARLDDGGETLFGDTHEGVGVGGGAHRVDGDTDAAVGTVLEADGERDTTCQLTVELRFGGTGTDGSPADEVSDVLRADGIQELGADGDTEIGEVAKEFASDAETLVDVEGAVEVGVVDETFPADCRAGFFEVSSHDDQQVLPLGDLFLQELGVGHGLLCVVDRARADDDEDAVILASQDTGCVETGGGDGLLGSWGGADLVAEESGLDERVVLCGRIMLANVSLKKVVCKVGSEWYDRDRDRDHDQWVIRVERICMYAIHSLGHERE